MSWSFTFDGDIKEVLKYYPLAVTELKSMLSIGLHSRTIRPNSHATILIKTRQPHIHINVIHGNLFYETFHALNKTLQIDNVTSDRGIFTVGSLILPNRFRYGHVIQWDVLLRIKRQIAVTMTDSLFDDTANFINNVPELNAIAYGDGRLYLCGANLKTVPVGDVDRPVIGLSGSFIVLDESDLTVVNGFELHIQNPQRNVGWSNYNESIYAFEVSINSFHVSQSIALNGGVTRRYFLVGHELDNSHGQGVVGTTFTLDNEFNIVEQLRFVSVENFDILATDDHHIYCSTGHDLVTFELSDFSTHVVHGFKLKDFQTGGHNFSILTMESTDDGFYLTASRSQIVSNITYGLQTLSKLIVIRLDNDFNIITQKELSNFAISSQFFGFGSQNSGSIVEMENGNLLIVSNYNKLTKDLDAPMNLTPDEFNNRVSFCAVMDKDLNLLYQNSIDTGFNNKIERCSIKDNIIYLSGTVLQNPEYSTLFESSIQKADETGFIVKWDVKLKGDSTVRNTDPSITAVIGEVDELIFSESDSIESDVTFAQGEPANNVIISERNNVIFKGVAGYFPDRHGGNFN